MRLSHIPVRLATGAFILDSGIKKWSSDDEEMQKHLHAMASTAYPQFADMEPRVFTRLLSAGEILVGGALLLPIVPTGVAGAALSSFSGGLLGLYLRLPGMRLDGGIRPSSNGTPLAKDSWMLGIGAALMIDALSQRLHRTLDRTRN